MPPHISRRQVLGGLAAGTTAGLAGCTDGTADEGGRERAFTIVPPSDPTGTGDAWSNWGGMTPYWTRVVEPLVWGTEEMQPKPWLATDWEATGDRTWVFELREDVAFHDGSEMIADDVVASFEDDILTKRGDFVYGWLHLEPGGVEKIDEYTVEFTNTEPFPEFPGTIGHNMIDVNPKGTDPHGGEIVGTGPFQLESIDHGQEVTVTSFDDYWGGDVTPESVTFRAAEDQTTRTDLLEAGDVDVIWDPSPGRLGSLREDDRFAVETTQSTSAHFVSINLYNAPTNDRPLRRALNYTVSQQEIVETVLEGVGVPARGPISTVIDWAADDGELSNYERDLERAADLVDDSSYDGEELSLIVRADDDNGDLYAEVLRASFDEVGVEVDVEVLESAAYDDRTDSGEFHLAVGGFQSNSPAADYLMWENFHSLGIRNIDLYEAEGTGLHNLGEEVDALIETGYQSRDPEKTREAYVDAQRRILDEAVVIPLIYYEYTVAADAALSGIDLHPIDKLAEWRTLQRE